jgi:SAM-dependent methyltransferase
MGDNLFDLSQEYDAMLNKGLRLSGEEKSFFIRGRLQDLQSQLPPSFTPRRILDFGCGIGDTTHLLAETFPAAEVLGIDTAEKALQYAEATYGTTRISFCPLRLFSANNAIDLCYVNGVFHHIQPAQRLSVVHMIRQALIPGGYFAVFENNPWNPGTRLIMSRIPFDRDAEPLNPPETQRLLRAGGFTYCGPTRFLFYFPRPLAGFRRFERFLVHFPFGAQYHVLAVK